jgi:hypothetical protein
MDREILAEYEIKRVGDERIVVDDQQLRLALPCHPRVPSA